MLDKKQKAVLDALQPGFDDAAKKTGLPLHEICRHLLAGTVKPVEAVNLETCAIEPRGAYCMVTFSALIPEMDCLRTYRWRDPNNRAIVSEQGQWVGVFAHFREWQDFIEAARQQAYSLRVHKANL